MNAIMTKENRINLLFAKKSEKVLNVYFTAGFPSLEDTMPIMKTLEKSGADLVEIGMPYSDPIADGPTIQDSNQVALANGMNIKKLFYQLKDLRKEVSLPVILMGYLNPVMQFGLEKFCEKCAEVGVDGVIIPDLPLLEYQEIYKPIFEKFNLKNIFLITPQTSEERIELIDAVSDSFIYMVSSASTTGKSTGISDQQIAYFERIEGKNLKNPRLIGFGISDKQSFETACKYAHGAIIGSAFIRLLEKSESLEDDIQDFVHNIKN
jgi:tryptophan synthase alpha chain